ncbi:MAG: DnaA/Hda family protein, partial [Phycisphaerales bacterium]|nr:DnaA/Hda family protein [Phycisphaerales bacterium]
MPANHNDITTRLTRQLVDRLGERPVAMWFKDTQLSIENNQLHVRAGTRFAADWIRRRFGEELQRLAVDVIDTDARVDIDVNPQAVRPATGSSTPGAASTQPEPPDRMRAPRPAVKRGPSMRFHQIDQFVVGSCNRLAWTAALQLASDGDHSPVSPLFIHGGCGLGKTHLLQGICRRVLELEGSAARVRYVTGEQFTNEYITAIRESTVDQFRARYRGLSLLAIDDVHFFRNKKKTQAEFMHTLDAIELTGARLALASDEHPAAIASFSKNLISRFMSGMVVKVERPDLDTRLMLVHQLAQNQSLRLNEAAARLLASKCLDSIREIQGAITRLAAMRMIDPEHLPSDDPEQLLIPGFNDASDRIVGPVAIRR